MVTLKELFDHQQDKSKNDIINREREKLFIENINKKDMSCPIINTVITVLKNDYMYDFNNCIGKGGMTDSYDFIFNCTHNNINVNLNIELKVLNSYKLPQLADIYIKNNNIIQNQYKSFCHNWLTKYLPHIKKKFDIQSDLPTYNDIQINICKPGKSPCEFLQELKENIKTNKENNLYLKELSKRFIDRFIKKNYNKINREVIVDLYKSKLNCKDFIIIYNKKQEQIKIINNKSKIINIELTNITKKYCMNNKYIVGLNLLFRVTKTNIIEEKTAHLRLVWKNNNGVYGPAWKLSPLE